MLWRKIEQDKEGGREPFHRGALGRVPAMFDQGPTGSKGTREALIWGKVSQAKGIAGAEVWQVSENRGMLVRGRVEEARRNPVTGLDSFTFRNKTTKQHNLIQSFVF